MNTVVLGVSRDSIASHIKFSEKLGLNFTLLSDVDGSVCNLYNVIKEKTMYGKTSLGIERSTFIINEECTILKVYRKVKVPGHADSILEFLK